MTTKDPFLGGTFLGQILAAPSLPGVYSRNFAPNSDPNFPEFFEDFSRFVSWETDGFWSHGGRPPARGVQIWVCLFLYGRS